MTAEARLRRRSSVVENVAACESSHVERPHIRAESVSVSLKGTCLPLCVCLRSQLPAPSLTLSPDPSSIEGTLLSRVRHNATGKARRRQLSVTSVNADCPCINVYIYSLIEHCPPPLEPALSPARGDYWKGDADCRTAMQ